MPVALAPVGLTGMQSADGEIKAAKAAEKFGVPFCLSTMSICSIEDVAATLHSAMEAGMSPHAGTLAHVRELATHDARSLDIHLSRPDPR